ncbi:tyrosine-type recombinase/integrase [Actinomadura terrae]|uniref:tyrosine-type recombinase/integrase n=1 Tax=Actinomadura terrae TaxID=604353 RepID=UPI001FA6D1B8|nr:tyrosine-type recombinase/integrase [Actinomadura terrae]
MAWAEQRGPWYRVRYRDAEGTVRAGLDKHRTKTDAAQAAEDMDSAGRRGQFFDLNDARTLLAEWADQWRRSHRVVPSTQAKCDHCLDCHILPAFSETGLEEIRRMAVKRWANELAERYAPSTVSGIVTLLSVVLTAAVEERMLAHNPVQGLRLPRTTTGSSAPGRRARPVPSSTQAHQISERIRRTGGRNAQVMAITAAWTGMRWGELAGLDRVNCHTGEGYLLIDPDVGSLHEVAGKLWLGPPKSEVAGRCIDLPPFLAQLLDEIIASHDHDQLFISGAGEWLRRSNFARRIWRPACDGDPVEEIPPILPGAVFHGLRHHHKTVLDELDVPDVLKQERMGHRMKGIQGVYSHVTDAMRRRLIAQLQRRWTNLHRRTHRDQP